MMRKLINLLLFVCYSNLLYSQDTPCSATPLVVNSGLCGVYTLGTTVGASYQNDAANGGTPTCASPGSPDVWYSFVAPATGLITITTSAGTITDSGIQIYSSSNNLCTGTLTALNCDDDGGPGLMSELNLCGLTPGNTYWVRVWKYNPGTGTFNICIYTPVSAPINAQNCSGATQVCSNSPFSGNSSGFSTQELNACNQGCLTVEHQSSWYVIQIQTSGTLNMTIAPGVGVDYDYALWGPMSSCPPSGPPIRCSFASGFTTNFQTGSYNTGIGAPGTEPSDGTGGTLDGWSSTLNVTAGQIYILLIDNFTSNATPFNLNWGGTAGLNCTPLPIELVSFEGYNYNTYNYITWVCATETNNDYFKLERSIDGINWTQVCIVDGAGTSNVGTLYSYKDFSYTRNEYNYYKLSQVDFNGQSETFDIISVNNINLSDRKIIKITNLMGQDVDPLTEGVLIYYYSDGTHQKVCKIKN